MGRADFGLRRRLETLKSRSQDQERGPGTTKMDQGLGTSDGEPKCSEPFNAEDAEDAERQSRKPAGTTNEREGT